MRVVNGMSDDFVENSAGTFATKELILQEINVKIANVIENMTVLEEENCA